MSKYLIKYLFLSILFINCMDDNTFFCDDIQVKVGGGNSSNLTGALGYVDKIGLYMFTSGEELSDASIRNEANNIAYTPYGDGTYVALDPEETIYFPRENPLVDFISYYPYKNNITNFIYPFDISNQNLQEALDFLFSCNAKQQTFRNPDVGLTFKHKMSSILFNISSGENVTDNDLKNIQITIADQHRKADFSLKDSSWVNHSNSGNISMKIEENGKKAIAMLFPTPQNGNFSSQISVTIPNIGELSVTLDELHKLEEGIQYTVPLIVGYQIINVGPLSFQPMNGIWENGGITVNERDYNTPNCYIVKPNSRQEIPMYKAYAVWKTHGALKTFLGRNPEMNGVPTAKIIWQDSPNLIKKVSLKDTEIQSRTKMEVETNGIEGNALVAFCINDTIRWSWHIWVTNYEPSINYKQNFHVNGETYTFMDRNLGALSNTLKDVKSLGLYYQYGRKDPFPGPNKFPPTDYPVNPIIVYNDANEALSFKYEKVAHSPNIHNSILNPFIFYSVDPWGGSATLSNEWYDVKTNIRHNFLWSTATGKKGIFDPCPRGWRTPTGEKDFTTSPWYVDGASSSGNNVIPFGLNASIMKEDVGSNFTASHFNLGYYPFGGTIYAEQDTLIKYEPISVYRDIGTAGYYNSAMFNESSSMMMRMSSNGFNANINVWQAYNRRSYGMNTRCVRHDDYEPE